MKRTAFLTLAASAMLLAASPFTALAQGTGFPSKPVTLIVPFPPGGAADRIGRAVADGLQRTWGKPVVVDNRAGAGGVLGAETAARAVGDPHTLLLGSIGVMTVNPHIYKALRYDPVKDFTPISLLATMPNVLVVNNSVPVHSLKEFIAHAKAHPGKLSFGSAGSGTTEHTNGVMLGNEAKLDLVHVPYKGISPSHIDLLGGRIDFIVEQGAAIVPLIKGDKVRALAVTTTQRMKALPNVPTFAESGFPAFVTSAWYALYAPAGIPAAIQQQISADLARSFDTAEVRERMEDISVDVTVGSPQDLARFQAAEMERWGRLVQQAGIRAD